jgi:hypothetical protein
VPRFILIDHNTGVIFGDTAAYAPEEQSGLTPIAAARLLDEREVHHIGRSYALLAHAAHDNSTGYEVYHADDAFPVASDGQHRDTIRRVIRYCEFIGFVAASNGRDSE